jgi:hypothetical protein|nr:MAG TPA: ERF superfamily protein [Caudoviricetes sp.]
MATNNLSNKFMQVLNEVPNFVTDETAQAGKRTYKYLNLATILKTIKPVFEKHGLAFSQRVTFNNTGEARQFIGTVETIIFDNEEQMVACSYPFFVTGDPQQVGSAITYARRYSLYAVLGIFPDKDDDGAYAKQRYETADRAISAEQYAELVNAMDAHNIPSEARGEFINGTLNRQVRGWKGLTQTDLNSLMNAVN